MSEEEKLFYRKAINDAREILIANGEKACDEGRPSESLVIGNCSRAIATLLDKI
jgi:hypothetical protein